LRCNLEESLLFDRNKKLFLSSSFGPSLILKKAHLLKLNSSVLPSILILRIKNNPYLVPTLKLMENKIALTQEKTTCSTPIFEPQLHQKIESE